MEDEKKMFRILNEILAQTTRMDKAIERLERKVDAVPKKKPQETE